MTDPKSPYSQNPQPPADQKDPYGNPKTPPKPDPCDDPNPDPKPPEKPPCPPPEEPCPKPKDCPEPPKPPCPPPEPCDDKGDQPPSDQPPTGYKPPTDQPPTGYKPPSDQPPTGYKPPSDQPPTGYRPPSDQPPTGYKPPSDQPPTGYKPPSDQPTGYEPPSDQPPGDQPPAGYKPPATGGEPSAPAGPAAHLAKLKARLEDEQAQLQRLEPLKTSMADLTQRIAALEKAVEGQATASSAYKEFFRTTEVAVNEIRCFIPTVRCQLDEIKEKHKKCICEAIDAVDTRVNKAKSDSAKANKDVEDLEKQAKRATLTLEWAKKWYEFLKTGLQQQVTKQRDDLKALKQLADPAKDQCEVWFYLYEMERVMKSWRADQDTKGEACWKTDLSVGTFLDCWGWECYEKAWNWVVVEFNTAEADEKLVKSKLDQAKKRATDLDKIAKEAESKRREWILKEIKAKECCGPASKCP